MSTYPLLYIHGGPGLHAEAERRWLAPVAARFGFELICWEERNALEGKSPSGQDSPVTFEDCVSSLVHFARLHGGGSPICVLAHSFGANLATELVTREPGLVNRLVFVAPALDLRAVFVRLIEKVARDARDSGQPEVSDGLLARLARSTGHYDSPMREALTLALQQPTALTHYWQDSALMSSWVQILMEPSWGLNMAAQESILKSYTGAGSAIPISKKVLAVFGSGDGLSLSTDQFAALEARFVSVEVKSLEGAGHFAQLERPNELFEALHHFLGESRERMGSVRAAEASVRGVQ